LRTQHLSALLFLTLYIGTGTISGLAGFVRQNPDAKQYNRAVNRRTQAARRHAQSRSVLASAGELWNAIERVQSLRMEHWENVERPCEDAADRLKQEARMLLLAAHRSGGGDGPRSLPGRNYDLTPPKEGILE
jgi:uncharacterized membrane protein